MIDSNYFSFITNVIKFGFSLIFGFSCPFQATLDSMSLLEGASAGWTRGASEADNSEADRVAVLEFELRVAIQ